MPPIIGIPCSRSTTEQASARYINCIEAAGGHPRLLRPGDVADIAFSGLLLTGGGDIHPSLYGEEPDGAGSGYDQERDALELRLLTDALRQNVPVYAICRGMQILNVAFGGKLLQDIPTHRTGDAESAYHQIYVIQDSQFARLTGLAGATEVNSRHHQGVRANVKAPGLVATAHRPDDGIVEALESPVHRFVIGVQCHPERVDEVPPHFRLLFAAFVEAAADASAESELGGS